MNSICTYASVRVENDWLRHVCCLDLEMVESLIAMNGYGGMGDGWSWCCDCDWEATFALYKVD